MAKAPACEFSDHSAPAICGFGVDRDARDYSGGFFSRFSIGMAADRDDLCYRQPGGIPLAQLKIDICSRRMRFLSAAQFADRRYGRSAARRTVGRAPAGPRSNWIGCERAEDRFQRLRHIFAEA